MSLDNDVEEILAHLDLQTDIPECSMTVDDIASYEKIMYYMAFMQCDKVMVVCEDDTIRLFNADKG